MTATPTKPGQSITATSQVAVPETSPGLQWTLFLLVLALIAVSFAAIFIRWSSVELGSGAIVLNRLWIATVALIIWEAITPKSIDKTDTSAATKISLNDYGLLLAVGTVSSTSVVLWALSLNETSVANSTVLRNLTPLFTSLGTWLVFGRSFDRRFLLGMFVAICGAIAIGVGDFQLAWHNLTGDILALLSALCYGTNLLLVENLRKRLTASQILIWRCGFGFLLLLPYVALTESQFLPQSLPVWGATIGLAVLCQCFGQGLVVHSLKTFSSGFVAIFLLLEPVITALLAWVLLGETLGLTNGLAFVVVLVGIYLAKSSRSLKSA